MSEFKVGDRVALLDNVYYAFRNLVQDDAEFLDQFQPGVLGTVREADYGLVLVELDEGEAPVGSDYWAMTESEVAHA